MKKVLLTGADGFTGRYLANALQSAGYEVHGLVHMRSSETVQGLTASYNCDLTDLKAVRRTVARAMPDSVVHFAAISFVGHGDVEAIYRTNILGTRNLLEALASEGHVLHSVLLASSANVYGDNENGTLTELSPVVPANDYAVSKLAMEHLAMLYASRMPITIARPFNYTGVGQSTRFLLPKMVDHFRRRASLIELGNLDVVRDFSDVRATVHRYHRLLEAAPAGQIFNICSGCGYSLRTILKLLEEISGHTLDVKVNPSLVRANEVRTLIGSRTKLDTYIEPVAEISMKETLTWMLESNPEVGSGSFS